MNCQKVMVRYTFRILSLAIMMYFPQDLYIDDLCLSIILISAQTQHLIISRKKFLSKVAALTENRDWFQGTDKQYWVKLVRNGQKCFIVQF